MTPIQIVFKFLKKKTILKMGSLSVLHRKKPYTHMGIMAMKQEANVLFFERVSVLHRSGYPGTMSTELTEVPSRLQTSAQTAPPAEPKRSSPYKAAALGKSLNVLTCLLASVLLLF